MKRFLKRSRRSNEPRREPESAIRYVDALPIGPGLIYPDMLPENVWGSNLRGILTRVEWDRLRIPVCEAAGNRCEVCGQPGYDPDTGRPRRPDCHELWHFEVTTASAIQRLARLIALCPDCHRVLHAGRAAVWGELSLVINQLRAVNCWSESDIRLSLDNAEDRYRWRRNFEWDLDLTILEGQVQVPDYPGLLIPSATRPSLGNSYFGD